MRTCLILITSALLSAFSTLAQHPITKRDLLKQHDPAIFPGAISKVKDAFWPTIDQVNSPAPARKGTSAIGSRLIAVSHFSYDTGIQTTWDTSSYLYSGTRGGDRETGMKTDYTYNIYPGYTMKVTNAYNSSDGLISAITQHQYGTSAFQNDARSTLTYDGAGNVSVVISETWDSVAATWYNLSKVSNTYITSGKLNDRIYQFWDTIAAAWTNVQRTVAAYDGSGNLTVSLMQTWDTLSASWLDASRYIFTYSSTNKMLTAIGQGWDTTGTGTWSNGLRESRTYDASDNMVEYTSEVWYGAWQYSFRVTYSSFVANKPQIAVYQLWNDTAATFDNFSKLHYTYNSHNQILFESGEDWNGTGWEIPVGGLAFRYYYEDYTTGVNNVSSDKSGINIYPVPATDKIQITNYEQQPIKLLLTDEVGRCVGQLELAGNSAQSLDVSHLAPGIYFVKGAAEGECRVSKTISVVR